MQSRSVLKDDSANARLVTYYDCSLDARYSSWDGRLGFRAIYRQVGRVSS